MRSHHNSIAWSSSIEVASPNDEVVHENAWHRRRHSMASLSLSALVSSLPPPSSRVTAGASAMPSDDASLAAQSTNAVAQREPKPVLPNSSAGKTTTKCKLCEEELSELVGE